MEIRNFRERDLDTLCRFQAENMKINFPELPRETEGFRRNVLEWSRKEPDGIKIIEEQGRTIGYMWLNTRKNYGLIRQLFIARKERGKGLGTELMKLAEDYFRQKGRTRIRLSVTADNQRLLKLYRRLGYREKRIVMEKPL